MLPIFVKDMCRRRLARESEAFKRSEGRNYFFVLTDDRGPCANGGQYNDVGFLNHHVIGWHGERPGAAPLIRGNGPSIPCFDRRKDIDIPSPVVHWPTLGEGDVYTADLRDIQRHEAWEERIRVGAKAGTDAATGQGMNVGGNETSTDISPVPETAKWVWLVKANLTLAETGADRIEWCVGAGQAFEAVAGKHYGQSRMKHQPIHYSPRTTHPSPIRAPPKYPPPTYHPTTTHKANCPSTSSGKRGGSD